MMEFFVKIMNCLRKILFELFAYIKNQMAQ